MSTITMPENGGFNFKCAHCSFDTGKPPIKKKRDGQDMATFYCGQCKGISLIKLDGVTATIMRVQQ